MSNSTHLPHPDIIDNFLYAFYPVIMKCDTEEIFAVLCSSVSIVAELYGKDPLEICETLTEMIKMEPTFKKGGTAS